MSKSNYQCNSAKVSYLKPPEGVKVTCSAPGSIISPKTKCKVECDSGSPNYEEIECRNVGWRPTKEVACEGVNAGVIIGVLIGGLFAVVILGIIYAKYKQKQKEKRGISTKVQNGKLRHNGTRPGQLNAKQNEVQSHRVAIDTPPVAQQPEAVNQTTSRNLDQPRPHHKSSSHRDFEDSKQHSKPRDASKPPHHKRKRREHSSKPHPQEYQTSTQHAYNPNPQGYRNDGTTGHVVMPQVGYQNNAYFQAQPYVGYGAADPNVGYSSRYPQSHPSRAYNVPT